MKGWGEHFCRIIAANQAINLNCLVSLINLVTGAVLPRRVMGDGGCGTHG